jgi:SAM-dependent methyltransferase
MPSVAGRVIDWVPVSEAVRDDRAFWDHFAEYDPLWAILSDPSKAGRRWDLESFLETGRREVSLLIYQLRALGLHGRRDRALDFGCGVGRLTQPLAEYFDRVVGVDVSPNMIRLAQALNRHPDRVEYVTNTGGTLRELGDRLFGLAYSNVVLQHIEPPQALRYLSELLRVVAAGGVLVFQLPSHRRPADEQQPRRTPMPDDGYRAELRIEAEAPAIASAGATVPLAMLLTNVSPHTWHQTRIGPIRLGNHWLSPDGRMLIQDDGRTALPEGIEPRTPLRVTVEATAPRDSGDYILECDLVHEGVSWFGDKGSTTWRHAVHVTGEPGLPASAAGSRGTAMSAVNLALPDIAALEPPGPLPMHGIHHMIVEDLIRTCGGTLVHREVDERSGTEWVGYRYFVRKGGRP